MSDMVTSKYWRSPAKIERWTRLASHVLEHDRARIDPKTPRPGLSDYNTISVCLVGRAGAKDG